MFSRQLKRLTVNNKDTDIITDIDKIFFFQEDMCAYTLIRFD